jgi:hypothetical protein
VERAKHGRVAKDSVERGGDQQDETANNNERLRDSFTDPHGDASLG